MKTNVIMTRKMGDFDVLQRTSDGYFDGNALLRQWNSTDGNEQRKMEEFLESKKTKEFVQALLAEYTENSLGENSPKIDNQVVKTTKSKIEGKAGRPKLQIWMHPYLFIKFAMWINPRFEVKVIKFVYDELIKNRHLAGDNYNKLTAQICKLKNCDYSKVAEALNYIVFNKHYRDIRNDASQSQLEELHRLEEQLAFSIQMGLITSFVHLINVMRKMYSDKYIKF